VECACRANLHARRGVALLTHHGNGESLPLPGVNVDTACGGPELPLVPETTGEATVAAARTPVRMNHQYICHNHPVRNLFAD
jgi:hypothetical protein